MRRVWATSRSTWPKGKLKTCPNLRRLLAATVVPCWQRIMIKRSEYCHLEKGCAPINNPQESGFPTVTINGTFKFLSSCTFLPPHLSPHVLDPGGYR